MYTLLEIAWLFNKAVSIDINVNYSNYDTRLMFKEVTHSLISSSQSPSETRQQNEEMTRL